MALPPKFLQRPLSPAVLGRLKAEAEVMIVDPDILGRMVKEYKDRFSRVIAADKALHLFPAYQHDSNTYPAFRESSQTLARAVYASYLQDPKIKKLIVLGGGCGSGKTFSLEVLTGHLDGVANNSELLVYDTTLSRNLDYERSRIANALASNLEVDVVLIYRPARKAAEHIVYRAEDNHRCIPLASISAEHFNAPNNFLALAQEFGSRVGFVVIDNSEDVHKPRAYTTTPDAEAFVEQHRYRDSARLLEEIRAGVACAYEKRFVETRPIRLSTVEQISGRKEARLWRARYRNRGFPEGSLGESKSPGLP